MHIFVNRNHISVKRTYFTSIFLIKTPIIGLQSYSCFIRCYSWVSNQAQKRQKLMLNSELVLVARETQHNKP
jgi:hypothetical protein